MELIIFVLFVLGIVAIFEIMGVIMNDIHTTDYSAKIDEDDVE